jgi:hypothetical protein
MLITSRVEAMVCALSVGVGGATFGLTVLSIGTASVGLRSTLLDLSARQHLYDLQMALAIVLAGLALLGAAIVSTMAFVNRRAQYATLRAMGWPRGSIAAAIVMQACSMALVGGAAAVAMVIAAGVIGGGNQAALHNAVFAACAVAGVSLAPLSVVPLVLIYRRSISGLLSDG